MGLAVRADDDELHFEVKDTGTGIEPVDQARIFEPFTQVDEDAGDVAGSVGLGLALTRELTERLGGSVAVDSAPGRGSRFTVRFPRSTGPTGA